MGTRSKNTKKDTKTTIKTKCSNIIKKHSTIIFSIILVVVFVVVLSGSYAFFTTLVKGKEFVIHTGTLAVNYTKKTNVINVENLYPMTNTEGLNSTAHEFTVTNDGNINARYQVRLELDNSIKDMISTEYIKLSYSIDGSSYSEPVLLSDLNSNLVFLRNIKLEPTKSNTIAIKMWIDINAPNDIQGKTFKAKVVVDSIQDVDDGYVVDTVPIIYLNKDKNNNQDINLKVGDTYTELGVNRVEDDNDVIKTSQVTKTYEYYDGDNLTTVNSVDTSKTGIYYITYAVTDSNNNTGKNIRIVTVNKTDSIPSITLNGNSSITLGENDYYKENGVTVSNDNKVIILGEVKTSTVGTYVIRYIAIDNKGNLNSVVRTVTIVEAYSEELLNGADPVLTDNLVPVIIADDGTVTKASTASEWYDYETKQWANAVVLKDNYDENTIYDLSGNGNNATIYGATMTEDGLSFDGIDDYAKIDLLEWNSVNEFTLEFKAKIEMDEIGMLFENSSDGTKNNTFFIDTQEGGTKDVMLTVMNPDKRLANIKYADNVINNNDYYTYTITFDADNTNNNYINIYVNGVKQNLTTFKTFDNDISDFILGDYSFFIGSRNGTEFFSKMTLNSLKIYNRELSETEITNNINGNVSINNLILAYDLDSDYQYYIDNNDTISEDSIESYFVWIPKYSYQLWDLGEYDSLTTIDSTKPHAIQIKFGLDNTSDTVTGECTTPGIAGESGNCDVGEYMTHPAFLAFDTNGIWVGKFETGYDGATGTSEAQTDVDKVDTSKIIIKPNVYSWRGIKVGNIFENSYQYLRSDESHMMKNTEWGAVAYLSHSLYGTCTGDQCNEIRINNSYGNTGYSSLNSPTIGFNNGTTIEGNMFEKVDLGKDGTYTVNYLNPTSVLASTTGNYTGIYDIAGGASEYVTGYTTGATTVGGSSGITTLYSDFFTNSAWNKYYDKYSSTSYLNFNNRILGDATGEMGPFVSSEDGSIAAISSWYEDVTLFADGYPWFVRGGASTYGTNSGAFSFQRELGRITSSTGFRIVLAPSKN